MRSRILAWGLVGVAALAMSTPVLSAKAPAPDNANFVPEIAYLYNGNNGVRDLRLANAAGTASMLVVRSNYAIKFDLAPRTASGARFAYVLCDSYGSNCAAYVNSWSYDAAGRVTLGASPTKVLQVPAYINGVDFSPDGRYVAIVGGGTGSKGVWTYDTTTGAVLKLREEDYWGVRYSSDGQSILAMGYGDNNKPPLIIMSVAAVDPLTGEMGATSRAVVVSGPNLGGGSTFDVSRPSATAPQQILLESRVSTSDPMYVWRFVGNEGTRLLAGAKAHFNCENSRFIYNYWTGRTYETRTAAADGSGSTLWSSDKNIWQYDWMNCDI